MRRNRRLRGFIPEQEGKYIDLLLDHVSPAIKEAGLERLCSWYRRGYRLKNPHPVLQKANGLLYSESKVCRWALNAIALFGTRRENLSAVLDAIQRYRNVPDVLGSAVAAFVSLSQPDDLIPAMKAMDIPLYGAPLLAAAQYTNAFTAELAKSRVDPETADAADLRLAALLVGLDKSPEHLFSANHENSAVVGVLNSHHDALVAQYSVWAICESNRLDVSHLGVRPVDIPDQPGNVRAWIYQLISGNASTAIKFRDYIFAGSEDPSEAARLGLALGLKGTYFDGPEELAVDWIGAEGSEQVQFALLEHMANHSEACPVYRGYAIDAYRAAASGSLLRARLEAAAAGMTLYGDLKRISLRSETLALFPDSEPVIGGQTTVTNITVSNSSVGAIAGRDVNIQGDVNVQQTVASAKEALAELASILEIARENAAREGLPLVKAAQENTSRGSVGKVLDWMKSAIDRGVAIVSAWDNFNKIYGVLAGLMAMLPS